MYVSSGFTILTFRRHFTILMNLKRCERKRKWPNVRYFRWIWPKGVRKTTKSSWKSVSWPTFGYSVILLRFAFIMTIRIW
jgi:hypothetical protein